MKTLNEFEFINTTDIFAEMAEARNNEIIEEKVDYEKMFGKGFIRFFKSRGFNLNSPKTKESQIEFDRLYTEWEEDNWEPNTDHSCC